MMKYIFLLAAWMIPGLALAEGAIPQIVQNFGEQQGIKIIKEIDSPAA
jgi:thiol:disulfide interchange protein DsbG